MGSLHAKLLDQHGSQSPEHRLQKPQAKMRLVSKTDGIPIW
jgi:hypothetical protein